MFRTAEDAAIHSPPGRTASRLVVLDRDRSRAPAQNSRAERAPTMFLSTPQLPVLLLRLPAEQRPHYHRSGAQVRVAVALEQVRSGTARADPRRGRRPPRADCASRNRRSRTSSR